MSQGYYITTERGTQAHVLVTAQEKKGMTDGMSFIALALDGPHNGEYIDFLQATKSGYWLDTWPHVEGQKVPEEVWSHGGLIDIEAQAEEVLGGLGA